MFCFVLRYDAHLLAWSDLQSALLAAGRAGDTATSQYELVKSRDPAEAAVEQQLHLESPDLFRAWLHVDVERVLDAWTDLHSCSESHAPLLAEHLRQLHGRAPKSLTEEKTWWTAEEEEQEEDRRERRG